MYKIILISGIMLCLYAAVTSAQPKNTKQDEILKKLDTILQNQENIIDYLRFIKNRV